MLQFNKNDYNVKDWYWNVSNTSIYSSGFSTFISANNPSYVSWLASGKHPTNIQDFSSLDYVLMSANLPITGRDYVAQETLLLDACANVCNFITTQIYSTPTRQTAAMNSAMIVGINHGLPPASNNIYYPSFLQFAQSWGYSANTLGVFANVVATFTQASMDISSTENLLYETVSSATNSSTLTYALKTFNNSITNIINTINSANPPAQIVNPNAIVIPGV